MNEFLFFRELFGGGLSGNTGLLSVALLIVLSTVCVYKPERVHSQFLFRLGILSFFLSIITPPIFQIGLQLMEVPPVYNRRMNIAELGMTYAVQSALRPCFLGLSILFTIVSITPRKEIVPIPQPNFKKKHPLDD